MAGTSSQPKLITVLTTILLLRPSNLQLSRWTPNEDIITKCLSYVSTMNIDNRQTVAVVVNSTANESYNNELIHSIISSTNLFIINSNHQMASKKIFEYNKFRHRLGHVTVFFIQITTLSSLHDKLHFVSRLTSVFDSRASFIVWHDTNTRAPSGADVKDDDVAQEFLGQAFSILWQFFIFNSIIVSCNRSSLNCDIFTWFPYHKNAKCGKSTQNFVQVDRCEFRPNDGLFYVNYLNSSRQIYENGDGNIVQNVQMSLLQSNKTVRRRCNQEPNRHLFNARNYFNLKPRGVLEFRQFDEDNRVMEGVTDEIDWRSLRCSGLYHFFEKIPRNLNGCQFRSLMFVWPPFVTPATSPWIGLEHKLILDVSRFMNFRLMEIYINVKSKNSNTLEGVIFKDTDADLAFGNLYPNVEQHQVMDYTIGYLYDHINWVVPLAGDQPVWLNLIHCFGAEVWALVVIVAVIFTLIYARICNVIANEAFSTGVMECVMVAAAASKKNLPTNSTIRFFLMIWILYCFHIHLMYQVQLMSVLTTPISEKQISTPAEIISKNLQFGFAENFAIHLLRINGTESRYFIKENKQCTFETCIAQMVNKPFATLGNRMYIQYSIAFEETNTKIFTISKPVAKSFIQMYMKKGFPLRDKLNFLIRRMVEIGYLSVSQRIYQSLVDNVSIDNSGRFRGTQYLELEHFTGAFIFLFFGSFVATSLFFYEHFHR